MTLSTKLQISKTIWFNQEPGPSDNPEMPPRRLQIVPAVVFLTNESKKRQLLTASTPCDIIDWQVELRRAVIEREPGQVCTQDYQMKNIDPNESIFSHFNMVLNSWLYQEGQEYDVKCLFWGQLATTTFEARIAS